MTVAGTLIRLTEGPAPTELRAVLDTSVLVSATRSKRGASAEVLRWLDTGGFRPVLSNALYWEWRAVLTRPEQVIAGRTTADAAAFVDAVAARAGWRQIHFLVRPALRDADDDHVLELAIAAGGVPIVTHNVRDFGAAAAYAVQVVTPAAFLLQLRSQQARDRP